MQSKITGNLVFLLVTPLSPAAWYAAYVGASVVRGLVVGTGVLAVTLHLPVLGLTSNGSFIITNNGQETFFTGVDPDVTVTGATKRL